jgi:putative peptide zinc metalloprotease protein
VATHGRLLGDAFGAGDVLEVLVRAVAIVAVVIPLLGIGYVLARLVRRSAAALLRRTEDRPVRRGVAVLLVAVIVAGLGWAWWPDGDRYRPVRAWEGGTLLDAVPASAAGGLGRGTGGETITIWPAEAGPLPTEDRPALALVLTPAGQGPDEDGEAGTAAADGGAGAPTWVFPFDAPLAPGEGDNQALADNTSDGSVAYDVSFALVWVTGDTAVNRNEAYALASCQDCRTVAVAFQVVLLVGSVDVVVPENVAVAVNYACVECVTQALATQLVVSLPSQLSQAGTDELASIWTELRSFGEELDGLPLAELRDRLTDFEIRILDVVRRDGAVDEDGDTAGDTSTDADPGSEGTAPDGDGDGAADGADGDDAAGPTATSTRSPDGATSDGTGSTAPETAASTSASPTSVEPTPGSETTTSSGTDAPTG